MSWKIDSAHTSVGFSVRHMMVSKVRGSFSGFEGTVDGDPTDLTNANINFTIDASTINTNQEDRDKHLQSADFFDVEKYPHITFTSTDITKTGENEYDITGDMTVKGETNPVTFKTTYEGTGKNPWGVDVVAFEAAGKISRKEFGLTWNQTLETGGVLVGDDINIHLEVQANPA